MSHQPFDPDAWLLRPHLELWVMINIARGADLNDWPPSSYEWKNLFREIKVAIDGGKLKATKRGTTRANKDTAVALRDLWRFVRDGGDFWLPLHDFCIRWSDIRGEALPGRSTSKAEVEARKWLKQKVASWDEQDRGPAKEDLLAEIQQIYPNLSQRSFLRKLWPEEVPESWKARGPKRRKIF